MNFKTEEEYKKHTERLLKLGIKPVFKTLKEKRKQYRESNKNARSLGYPRGYKQMLEEGVFDDKRN